MKNVKRTIDIFEKIQNEVNSVLEMHRSASDVWYRDRFSTEVHSEVSETMVHSDFAEEPVKKFA